ncbi:hypothetical protein [Pseudomonas sp. COR18]|uniref:hypothetical protein n=1 Tax=Pseudomonas sp. COR18 TaxID=3399680 RepID=UPI003B00F98A
MVDKDSKNLKGSERNKGFPTELITEPQDKLSFNSLFLHLLHIDAKDFTLKWIFDHIRNYIICGVLFWSGLRAINSPKITYVDTISENVGGGVLVLSSLVLFAFNMLHGIVGVSKVRNLSTVGKFSYLIFCFLALFAAQVLYKTAKSS